MAYELKTSRRVEFAETDCAGIAHFSVYFRYFEEAEHAFLRSLGLSVHAPLDDGHVLGFPRLAVRCEYSRSLRFEDVVQIHVWVSRKTRRILEYSCIFSRDGEEVARAHTSVIACRVREGLSIEPTSLPESFDRLIEPAPYPPLEFHPGKGGGPS